ncbi:MAG: type III pantothenate kinase [bacterium]|nr:type III pantothenate kinase [bacterium]
MKRFVALDIGNTHITVGWWEGGLWRYEWRFSSKARRTADEWTILFDGALRRAEFPDRKVDTCGIASVVPALTREVAKALGTLCLSPVQVVHEHLKSVQITYDPPSAVGPDRICGVATAVKTYGAPVIVVDLGTATVVDVVDADRVYRGGIIAPGVATAAESLNQLAALLPRVDLAFPPSVIGTNTVNAIQSGVLHGALAMIDGLVDRIHGEIGSAPVVATGGFAGMIQSRSKTITCVDQHLVLEGIRLLVSGEWS